MSYAELKTLVNSKMPGQEGFAPIDAMIRELQAQTQKESEYYHIFAPKFNMNNTIDIGNPILQVRGSELKAKNNKTFTLVDIDKKGLLFSNMVVHTYTAGRLRGICSRISGEITIDFGYGALVHSFDKEPAWNTSTTLFILTLRTGLQTTYYMVDIAGDQKISRQLSLPYPIQVDRFRVTYKYILHDFNENVTGSQANDVQIYFSLNSQSNSSAGTIIGGLNE